MGLDLSPELFAFPDRNGLDRNSREDRVQILKTAMSVPGDIHVVDGLLAFLEDRRGLGPMPYLR